jgi:hypothetical protein
VNAKRRVFVCANTAPMRRIHVSYEKEDTCV